jgi:3-oxoacyl-[acyl-carrier protein] reductase
LISLKLQLNSIKNIKEFAKKADSYDCIIFNAGINKREDFLEITEESYNEIMNINLKSYVFLVQELERKNKLSRNMRLIFISSVASEYYGPKTLHYMLSKIGINGFVKFLAQRYSDNDIYVNGISPGLIYTEQTKEEFDNGSASKLIDKTLLKRPGSIIDVLSTVEYLIDEKNRYLTGQIISLSGGAIL